MLRPISTKPLPVSQPSTPEPVVHHSASPTVPSEPATAIDPDARILYVTPLLKMEVAVTMLPFPGTEMDSCNVYPARPVSELTVPPPVTTRGRKIPVASSRSAHERTSGCRE